MDGCNFFRGVCTDIENDLYQIISPIENPFRLTKFLIPKI
jgi:hypothetical protein